LVKLGYEFGVRSNRMGQGLDDSMVMTLACRAIAASGQGDRCNLQGAIVRQAQACVRTESSDLTIGQVPVCHGQQVSDFLRARAVLN
jgi:hypothetical protein